MLERLQEQRMAIAVYSQENEISTLTTNQWNIIEKLVKTLRLFQEQTKEASLSSATCGMIIPGYRLLQRFLEQSTEDGIQQMQRDMLSKLNRRFGHLVSNKVCALATVLDPTCKFQFFLNEELDTVKHLLLTEALYEYDIQCKTNKPTTDVAAATECTASDKQPEFSDSAQTSSLLNRLWQEFTKSGQSPSQDSRHNEFASQRFHLELRSYMTEPVQPRSSPPVDPIAYWKTKAIEYPLLSACAKKFLTTPPSSVESERAFSTAGQINDDRRSCLSTDKLKMLLFLKKNGV